MSRQPGTDRCGELHDRQTGRIRALTLAIRLGGNRRFLLPDQFLRCNPYSGAMALPNGAQAETATVFLVLASAIPGDGVWERQGRDEMGMEQFRT